MPFSKLDTPAVARTLSQVAEQPDDVVDAFFERREEVELAPEGEPGGLRVWREEGFAVRLSREGRTWLASRDAVEARPFAEALRQVARAFSSATSPGRCGRITWDSPCASPFAGTAGGCRWSGPAWCRGPRARLSIAARWNLPGGATASSCRAWTTAPPRRRPPPWWPCSAPGRRLRRCRS